MGGYRAQYYVSACVIVHNIREHGFEWVRIADPQAGRVDDLVIGTHGRVDAYQDKSTLYGGLITFNDLTRKNGQNPGLIAQLAAGWSDLRKRYPDRRVVVHFVTNQTPSDSKGARLPVGISPPTPPHFSAFIEQVWKPIKRNPSEASADLPAEWLTTWNAMREASGLIQESFADFVLDCELEFGFGVRSAPLSMETREQQIVDEDIRHVADELSAIAGDPQRVIELSKEELLRRLNWQDRVDFRNSHQFPVDDRLYRPIGTTAAELSDAISAVESGYIVVLGTPGSGKSTLLTETLRKLDIRLVRYYAYVPDAVHPSSTRGESINFLHDVELQLDRDGFNVGQTPVKRDLGQLLDRFYEQLELLHKDWMANGRKTVILIDGLDHIEREQHPNRSLLYDLPEPNKVPDGVVFVLGTQTTEPIPSRIKAAVEKANRKITMQPLARQQVHEIVGAADLPVALTQEQLDRVYQLSDGHPLHLVYLIKQLGFCASTEHLVEVLFNGEPYTGHIDATYQTYWDQIKDEAAVRSLLGLVARIRGVIDITWIRTWAEAEAVQRTAEKFAHYFRIENSTRWYFFHNSFRLFLVQKTAEFLPGDFDLDLDRNFHVSLAEHCANAKLTHPAQSWEELHHRARAEQHSAALELATQSYFRDQFIALRPPEAIRSDILTAVRSAAVCQDPTAVARLCLIASEIVQRGFHLEQVPVVPTLLRLGKYPEAIEALRSGNRLRMSASTALAAVKLLMNEGLEEEARRLFGIAEPIDPRYSTNLTDTDLSGDSIGFWQNWARAAVWLLDTSRVVESIRQIHCQDTRFYDGDDETLNRSLQARLLLDVGLELIEQLRWSDLPILFDSFDVSQRYDVVATFWLHFHACEALEKSGSSDEAVEHLNEMLNLKRQFWGPDEMAALAEGTYRLLGDFDHARQLMEGVPHSSQQTDLRFLEEGTLDPLPEGFRLSRLTYLLGDRRSSNAMIQDVDDPSVDDPSKEGEVLFKRAMGDVAHIWARAWSGQPMDSSAIKVRALPLIRTLCRPPAVSQQWNHLFNIFHSRWCLYEVLIEAVAGHGDEALNGLRQVFEEEWSAPESARDWPVEMRRRVICAFVLRGGSTQWGAGQVLKLGDPTSEHRDVMTRMEECIKHASAWLDVGNREQARLFVDRALEATLGVGYSKDYQLDQWIGWLGRINEIEPRSGLERISRYAQAIADLDESTEGGATESAAEKLLAVTYRLSPKRAIGLFSWFMDRRLISYQRGIAVLVEETLNTPDPARDALTQVTGELLVPFDDSANSGLMACLIKRVAASGVEANVQQETHFLASKIRRYAPPNAKPVWFQGLAKGMEDGGPSLLTVGVKEEDLRIDDDQSSYRNELRRNDGSQPLGSEEIEGKITSVSDVARILQIEDSTSLFNWTPVITQLVRNTNDRDSLKKLAQLFETRYRSSRVLAHISIRLKELGDDQSAWTIGVAALESSSNYDWSHRFDGGVKVFVLKALAAVDKKRATKLAYDTLAEDLAGDIQLIAPIAAAALDDILELLRSPVPVREIWAEIEEYVTVLTGAGSTASIIDVFGGPKPKDTPQRALIELMAVLLDHVCPALAQASQRGLGKLLLADVTDVYDTLTDFLGESETYQERILMLMDAVSATRPSVVSPFRRRITELAESPNWRIRETSKSIIKKCEWDEITSGHNLVPLPTIYSRPLPPSWGPVIRTADVLPTEPTKALADSDDPVRMVFPLNRKIELLSECVDVPVQNLYRRVAELMHQLEPRNSKWSEQAEEHLKTWLRSVGLMLSYARPRTQVARRALFHATGELEDAGALSGQDKRVMQRVLRAYDPLMVLAEPGERPTQIRQMMERLFGFDLEEWVENVAAALMDGDWSPSDQQVVLAEETKLAVQDRRYSPTEIRCAVFATDLNARPDRPESPEMMFMPTMNRLVSDYASLNETTYDGPLILRHTGEGYDSPGANWLAINPVLAHRLGWHVSEDGWFRWVDAQHQTMVESVWWTDGIGNLAMRSRGSYEVGEGWAVIASQCAWDQIQRELGQLSKKYLAIREFIKDAHRISRKASR